MAIPVIDFSKLNGNERAETLAQIADGCQNWGFFQLVNHGIPLELLERRVKKVCADCYKLEREELFKDSDPVRLLNKLVDSGEGDNGRQLDDVDWEDVFYIGDDNLWPSTPKELKETMKVYRAEIKKLAEKVMEVMDENLGLEKAHMKGAFSGGSSDNSDAAEHPLQPFFGTKVSHYPPCPHPELVNGLRSHTDAGGLILLFQDDEVSGLQVLKDGEWIDVQPLHSAIVINMGDQIEVVSNGRYKSAWHRILPNADGNRLSVASFYNPAMKATIKPAVELVEAPGLYPKFVFGDYMSVYADQKFLPKEPRFQAMEAM